MSVPFVVPALTRTTAQVPPSVQVDTQHFFSELRIYPCMTEIYLHIVARMADYTVFQSFGVLGVDLANSTALLLLSISQYGKDCSLARGSCAASSPGRCRPRRPQCRRPSKSVSQLPHCATLRSAVMEARKAGESCQPSCRRLSSKRKPSSQ